MRRRPSLKSYKRAPNGVWARAMICVFMTGARRIVLAMCATILILPTEAQDRTQARSMVVSRQGIVATSQTLASVAGAKVLERGGDTLRRADEFLQDTKEHVSETLRAGQEAIRPTPRA